jgi:hypothetical protein
MTVQNSLNLNSNGVVTFNNTTGVFSGSALTQHYVLLGGASNAITSLNPGSTAGIPLVSAGSGADPTFGTAVVAGGGTGATSFTAHSLLLGQGTSAITALGAATDGQLPIGSTGADPVLATLTAGTGISISNGAGSITINATGAGLPWTDVTGTTQTIAINNGYLADNAGLVTFTLPATAAQFSVFRIVGRGAGGWTIAQNAGQQIIFGNSSTTAGVTGSLSSTNANDVVEAIASVGGSSTIWTVMSSVGNLNVV